jgi:hypothetical protein
MTVKEARDRLPDVTVVPVFGVFLRCKTSGREERFAIASALDDGWRGCSWQFSWEAVARAATNGNPLYA